MITIPHLETNVTVACQLRCVACNHFVALQAHEAKQRIADVGQIERDLGHLSKVLHAEAWGALGGEPLLHPQLLQVLEVVHRSGICDKIEVWTNGIAARRQPDKFWESPHLDRLVLSVYPGTLPDTEIDWIKEKCASVALELWIKDERAVPNFEQLLEPVASLPAVTRRKYQGCFFKNFSRVIDNGYLYRCCTSPFIPRLLLGLPEGTDGLPVENVTEQQIEDYLSSSTPAVSCTRCAGLDPSVRRRVQWQEQRDAPAWLAASAGGVYEG
jgi:cyclic pyranopterin phosphate synthase